MKNARETGTRKTVTLRDVAAAAGVSAMTVSNVVNGRFDIVNIDTRRRVERAIGNLNYRPDLTARGLRLSASWSVGILIVSDVPSHVADPLVTQTIIGLSDRLQQDGYSLVVQSLRTDELERSTLVRNTRTDGMCLVLAGTDTQRKRALDLLCGLGQPIVLFQDTIGDARPDVCVIRQDDFSGARKLAALAIQQGARKLVMLVPSIISPGFQERERGFRATVNAAAKPVDLKVVRCGDGSFTTTQGVLARFIKRSGVPDAILGGNDQLGIAALQHLTGLGYRVPDDVVVTGFNAFEIWQYSIPTLTTVQSPAYAMGARAAAELFRRLETGRFAKSEIRFPVRLQRGGSA